MTPNSDTMAVKLFNTLIGQYNGSFAAIQKASTTLANELFVALALISIAVLGINRLLSKNVDFVESNIELIKLLIYFNVFYLFIDKFPNLLPSIVESFKHAAFYMGNQINQAANVNNAANFKVATNPGDIVNLGVNIATTVIDICNKQTNLINFGMSLIGVLAAAVIIFCFGCIAIQICIIEISSKIILAAGIIMLAFSASQWTRDYATRYIAAYFGIGVQMLFTYLLVGIGSGLASTWVNTLTSVPGKDFIPSAIAVVMAAFVYYKISLTLPTQAAGYLSGGLTINPGKAPSIGVATAVAVGGLLGAGKLSKSVQVKMDGMSKAWSAASKVVRAEHGEKKGIAGRIDNFGETIKTLGSADDKIQKERWDAKVDQTYPGQLAQKIKSEEAAKAAKALQIKTG